MSLDDDDLWDKVTKGVKPLEVKKVKLNTVSSYSKKEMYEKIRSRRIEERPLSYALEKYKVTFESLKYFEKKQIEDRLDLHGLTCQEAEMILDRFFYKIQINGLKTVLIITGKGTPKECNTLDNPGPYGVLRMYVCKWFEKNGQYIVCYSEAKIEHGGKGAFYVHVRKH
jgi:DNA-nicking Smr family endonuclease